MSRRASVLAIGLALSITAGLARCAGGPTAIYVNGQRLQGQAITKDGTVYVPMRAVAEALGASASWNPAARTVHLDRAGPARTSPAGPAAGTDDIRRRVTANAFDPLTALTEQILAREEAGTATTGDAGLLRQADTLRDQAWKLMAEARTGWQQTKADEAFGVYVYAAGVSLYADHLVQSLRSGDIGHITRGAAHVQLARNELEAMDRKHGLASGPETKEPG